MNETLANILVAVLIPTIPILLKFLVEFLQTKAETAKDLTKKEELDKYIDLATNTVIDVVTAIAQTTVDGLKQEGAFTKDKQKEVFITAKNDILALLPAAAKTALDEVYGDLGKWLDTKIEAEVKNLKANN